MGLPYYAGLIAIAIFAVGVGIFAVTYEITTYEDEQNLENQLWSQTNDLENRLDIIRDEYKVGIITGQEAYDRLEQLKIDTQSHLKFIEEKIRSLNTSHIYKNTQQLLVYLDEEIKLMVSIIN
jgi:hypothetical protein